MEVDWQRFAVQASGSGGPDATAAGTGVHGLIKEYLPEENGSRCAGAFRPTLCRTVGDTVYFDLQSDRLSLWTGTGEVSSVPLDADTGALLAKTGLCARFRYDLKNAIVQAASARSGVEPPYDDPQLMAYLLFPNRGKYELDDVVFDIFGSTLAGDRDALDTKSLRALSPAGRRAGSGRLRADRAAADSGPREHGADWNWNRSGSAPEDV